jgi:HSP20 family protein
MLGPFRRGGGFWDMQSEMNRMLDDMLGTMFRRPQRQLAGVTEWAPAVDVVTKNGDLMVRAELPGVK